MRTTSVTWIVPAAMAIVATFVVLLHGGRRRSRRTDDTQDSVKLHEDDEYDRVQTRLVVGLGVACLDYIATVENFPAKDEKIRTSHASVMGGGNGANTMVAMSRLGGSTRLVSKVGEDQIGDQILQGLTAEGTNSPCINLSPLIRP